MPPDNMPDPAADGEHAKPNRGPLVGAIIGGLLIGAIAGAFVLAPRLSGSPHTAASASHDSAAAADSGVAPTIYTLDNLVLNPAQTAGTRFLMVSVALELGSPSAQKAVEARDAEIRDAILRTLGSKTIAELANMAQRDSLRSELQSSLAAKFPAGAIRRVYFPQFVIQ